MRQVDFTIRNYREADIPAILAVIKEAFREYQGKLIPPSSAERKTIEIVRAELAEATALVAEVDGQIGGCVFYRPQAGAIYLDRLAVLPQYRRRGMATALLARVEAKARDLGFASLTLSVRLALEGQQRFYERLGFVAAGQDSHPGFTEPTSLKMKKTLL
jgi:predicted N-acetyltransferase YhbS